MDKSKKRALIVVASCAGLCAVGAFVLPELKKHDDGFPDAINDHVFHERTKSYASAGSAPKSGDGEGLFVLPDWVPQDATNVKVKVKTTGNAKLMRFTRADTPLKLSGADCPEGAFSDGPTLDAAWWSQDVGDGAGRAECSGQYQFRVAVKGDHVYAWSNGDLVRN